MLDLLYSTILDIPTIRVLGGLAQEYESGEAME